MATFSLLLMFSGVLSDSIYSWSSFRISEQESSIAPTEEADWWLKAYVRDLDMTPVNSQPLYDDIDI